MKLSNCIFFSMAGLAAALVTPLTPRWAAATSAGSDSRSDLTRRLVPNHETCSEAERKRLKPALEQCASLADQAAEKIRSGHDDDDLKQHLQDIFAVKDRKLNMYRIASEFDTISDICRSRNKREYMIKCVSKSPKCKYKGYGGACWPRAKVLKISSFSIANLTVQPVACDRVRPSLTGVLIYAASHGLFEEREMDGYQTLPDTWRSFIFGMMEGCGGKESGEESDEKYLADGTATEESIIDTDTDESTMRGPIKVYIESKHTPAESITVWSRVEITPERPRISITIERPTLERSTIDTTTKKSIQGKSITGKSATEKFTTDTITDMPSTERYTEEDSTIDTITNKPMTDKSAKADKSAKERYTAEESTIDTITNKPITDKDKSVTERYTAEESTTDTTTEEEC